MYLFNIIRYDLDLYIHTTTFDVYMTIQHPVSRKVFSIKLPFVFFVLYTNKVNLFQYNIFIIDVLH